MKSDQDYLRSPRAIADLKALNARFIHNYVTNDVASHDAILHPSFLVINSNGSRTDRSAYLGRWATGLHPKVVTNSDVRDKHIAVIGNVALVRATNKHTVHLDGKATTGMTTYTDTYLFEAGVWLCIQAQLTPVSAGFEPADDTIRRSLYLWRKTEAGIVRRILSARHPIMIALIPDRGCAHDKPDQMEAWRRSPFHGQKDRALGSWTRRVRPQRLCSHRTAPICRSP